MRSAASAYPPRTGVAFDALQIRAHFRSTLIPQVTVLLHPLVDQLSQLCWKRGVKTQGIRGILVQDFVKYGARTLAFEWQRAGRHFVEHYRKRKQVASSVQILAQDLFR